MGAHVDPVAPIVAALGVPPLAGKLGGELATRAKQPAVLGELIAGIVLGNLSFGGYAPFHAISRKDQTIEVLAGIGALILLFEVGVGSTVAQMLQVGITSLFVAALGVSAVPFALGWGVGRVAAPRREFIRPRISCAPRSPPPASASPRASCRTSAGHAAGKPGSFSELR